MMIAPAHRHRDQALKRAHHRPDNESFGANRRIMKKYHKYLKNLIVCCPETIQEVSLHAIGIILPCPTERVYNRSNGEVTATMTTTTTEQNAAAPAGNHRFSLISNEKLLQLYTSMVKCRIIQERAQTLFEQGQFAGNFGAGVGLEAATVGVVIDLLPEDTVAPSHGDLISGFVTGEPLSKIFGRLFVRTAGPELASQPGDQLHRATSAALANKKKNNGRIAVAFLGDRTTSLNFWHEEIKTAGTQQLPILFVCHSNRGPESGNLSDQASAEEIALQEEACGFPWITVDGNDAVAVYRVATEAIVHARKGNGPTLIECRLDRSEVHDPILKMEAYLLRKGLFSEELKLEAAAGFISELAAAVKTAEA
jgi:TPP-dependent pyruvate/acetoin dehydrogenase alpha subunit